MDENASRSTKETGLDDRGQIKITSLNVEHVEPRWPQQAAYSLRIIFVILPLRKTTTLTQDEASCRHALWKLNLSRKSFAPSCSDSSSFTEQRIAKLPGISASCSLSPCALGSKQLCSNQHRNTA